MAFDRMIRLCRILDIFMSKIVSLHKLTLHQLYILDFCNREWNVSVQRLRNKLLLTSASLSRTLSTLYKRDIIQKVEESSWDKRVIYITLTQTWKDLMHDLKFEVASLLEHEDFAWDKPSINLILNKVIDITKWLYQKVTDTKY